MYAIDKNIMEQLTINGKINIIVSKDKRKQEEVCKIKRNELEILVL